MKNEHPIDIELLKANLETARAIVPQSLNSFSIFAVVNAAIFGLSYSAHTKAEKLLLSSAGLLVAISFGIIQFRENKVRNEALNELSILLDKFDRMVPNSIKQTYVNIRIGGFIIVLITLLIWIIYFLLAIYNKI